ncbi:hypothetical protein OQA88_11369 [Cercophora sp. LCS_1]
MTSSQQDGAGEPMSPAPPAFSPLTAASASGIGSREPSVKLNLDDNSGPPLLDSLKPTHVEPALVQGNPRRRAGSFDFTDEMLVDNPPAMDFTMAPFSDQSGADLYQQTPGHILFALAQQIAAAQQPAPSTVRPSQVSLPHSILDVDSHGIRTPNNPRRVMHADAPLESFARIEFADSTFQMTTYAVIIGRDQRALKQARRDELREREYSRLCEERLQLGLPPPSPPLHSYRGKFSKSYVSEEGGMLGPESDEDDNPRPAKKRKTSGAGNSASGDSQMQNDVTAAEPAAQDDPNLIVNRQYVSHTPGAAAVNLSALRPSPHHVPFIGIHSPGPAIASRTKAISREHLKIQFNPEKGVFEAIPLHRNGFFCEDVHYSHEKVVLKSGDRLQIKDVDFVFVINGVPRGETGGEEHFEDGSSRRYSEGGKEMSFDFESNRDQEKRSTSPEEVARPAQLRREESVSELSEAMDEEMDTPQQVDGGVIETIERDVEEEQKPIKPENDLAAYAGLLPLPPKKRGPGRPPKNGIMSKREERLRKKAAMELQKQNQPPPPPGEPPIKRKVGRPRKHPLPEDAGDRPEKRKYKPRKKNGEEGVDSDPERAIKEKRREKPKTPPLELQRGDYTDEQLQKPNKNYGVLIDEVLSAAPDGLTLKQIYKRIQMKYPFYYFTVDTKGWESSVRHNLIGNDAFKKNEETHLWSRVPGIDIDAGKKRKAASPDHLAGAQVMNQHYQPGNPAHVGMAQNTALKYPATTAPQRPSYSVSQSPGVMGQQPQQYMGVQQTGMPQQQPLRQAYQVPGQATTHQQPGYADPHAARAQQSVSQGATYPAPYAPKPMPATPAQPGATPHSMARQYAQPTNGTAQPNGLPQVNRIPAQGVNQGATPASRPQQTAGPSISPLPLKPAVPPELIEHVANFKKTVAGQLKTRCANPEAVAISAVRRGLGLTTQSMVPESESIEKIVMGVFETSRKTLGDNKDLNPRLLQALLNFKTLMITKLTGNLGVAKSELLILSAIDRVLGFAQSSVMQGNQDDMAEYDKAEGVLMTPIRKMVEDHQRSIAAAPSASNVTPTPSVAPSPIPRATPAPGPSSFAQAAPPPQYKATSATPGPTGAASPYTPLAAAAPAPSHSGNPALTRAPVPSPVQAPIAAQHIVPAPPLAPAPAATPITTQTHPMGPTAPTAAGFSIPASAPAPVSASPSVPSITSTPALPTYKSPITSVSTPVQTPAHIPAGPPMATAATAPTPAPSIPTPASVPSSAPLTTQATQAPLTESIPAAPSIATAVPSATTAAAPVTIPTAAPVTPAIATAPTPTLGTPPGAPGTLSAGGSTPASTAPAAPPAPTAATAQ